MKSRRCQRGEVYFADLNPVIGHEQGGRRPVLIIQNDVGNQYSPTTIVAPLTTTFSPMVYPTEVRVRAGAGGGDQRLVHSAQPDQNSRQAPPGTSRRAVRRDDDAAVDEAIKISLGLVSL